VLNFSYSKILEFRRNLKKSFAWKRLEILRKLFWFKFHVSVKIFGETLCRKCRSVEDQWLVSVWYQHQLFHFTQQKRAHRIRLTLFVLGCGFETFYWKNLVFDHVLISMYVCNVPQRGHMTLVIHRRNDDKSKHTSKNLPVNALRALRGLLTF
jgi:hypothetical protein